MTKPTITILQLYPRDMNIYGDNGNVLVLQRRLEWQDITPNIISYNVGDTLPEHVDIIIGGGGQDSGQDRIQKDLLSIAPKLREWAEAGTPMLMVCGLYQLFGKYFKTVEGHVIEGISIFDITTHGSHERLIGNIVTRSSEFGDIVGYENHSGQTVLGDEVTALASVIKGAGNNSGDGHEGARYKNVIGTYLHGSLLPKNPKIADFLIRTALKNADISHEKQPINDKYAEQARKIALQRPR